MKVTIDFKGKELQCHGIFSPGEACQLYGRNGDPGHPGEPAEFEVESIEIEGVEFFELFDNLNLIDEIEMEILLKIANDE